MATGPTERATYPLQTIFPDGGVPGLVVLGGSFTIGSAGAISAQTGAKKSGATVAYVASGLYTVTFYKTVQTLISVNAIMTGPDAAAFPTTTGSATRIRVRATTGFKIQGLATATQADADYASGTIIDWIALVQA